MIKQTVFFSLTVLTLLNASSAEAEIGINVGMTSTKNNTGANFKNPNVGVTLQYNNYVVMPRFDVEYVKLKDERATSLLKGSFNGVYEFENKTTLTPYVLAGIGYENVQGGKQDEFESHSFVQGGGGLRIDLPEGFNGKLEGKFLQILGGEGEENEAIITAGISFPIGYEETPKQIVRKPIIRKKSIMKPIVIKTKPKFVYVSNNECSIKIDLPDLDRDGIEDQFDQCPATPCNFTVDNYGCPIKTTLNVNFPVASAKITSTSMMKIDEFSDFLLRNKGSRVTIVGHTDNRGSGEDNLALSHKRAVAVVHALVKRGVSPSRLLAKGEGEGMPIASNTSSEGRAMNRRIEAELIYPKGRR